jgi:peptidoglycan hydrolase-like protein with peptidoglycan-binding domain
VAALVSLAADPQNASKQTTAKQAPAKQLATKSTAVKSTAVKSGAAKTTPPSPTKSATAKSTSSAKLAAKKAPPKPRYYAQLQPTPERYKEIQQALVDKGYFSGTPDGVWGASSTDALKRFQHDQNLSEDGKVDSLSLIALGLGPKRTASVVEPAR